MHVYINICMYIYIYIYIYIFISSNYCHRQIDVGILYSESQDQHCAVPCIIHN